MMEAKRLQAEKRREPAVLILGCAQFLCDLADPFPARHFWSKQRPRGLEPLRSGLVSGA